MGTRVLYISYDGMLEPLGQSQVLRYLERLARDHTIILISIEKAEDWADAERREALRQQIRVANITWIPLRYQLCGDLRRPRQSAHQRHRAAEVGVERASHAYLRPFEPLNARWQ